MKTKIKTFFLLAVLAPVFSSHAQWVTSCAGSPATVIASNTAGLSNPSYSMNPGGVTSNTPTFVVSPTVTTTYTLYVTGTNSSSALITITNTQTVVMSNPTYSLVCPQGYTIGCGSHGVAMVNIINAQTQPISGGAVSYSFVPPGGSTVLPTGTLSSITSATISTPGSWSVAVRDNSNLCVTWSTFQITIDTLKPVINPVLVNQPTLSCLNPTAQASTMPLTGLYYHWQPSNVTGTAITFLADFQNPSNIVLATETLIATDLNNGCMTETVVNIYQNVFVPSAIIGTGGALACTSNSIVLTNMSISGIPPSTFPATAVVASYLWQAPSWQPTLGLSSTFTANASGVHTMNIIDNNNGCTSTATVGVEIKPLAAFAHTVSNGTATFNDLSSGVGTNSNYFWDFGDGYTSTAQHPNHTYQSSGSHLVKLKVSNTNTTICADSVIQSISVNGIPCVANSGFSMVPTGTAQVWNVVPSYPWNIVSATWHWGDGSSSNTLYTAHQYSAAGMYNICLSVTVSCVGSSSTCTSYSVYRSAGASGIIAVNVIQPDQIEGIASVAEGAKRSLQVVPNPNTGDFVLRLVNAGHEPAIVAVQDLTGRTVFTEQVDPNNSNALHLNIQDLHAGVYFVSVVSAHRKDTIKMVVER